MSFINTHRVARPAPTRLSIVALVCLLLSACATKEHISKDLSVEGQALQDQYRSAVDALKALESRAEETMSLGVLKDDDELKDVQQQLLVVHQERPWYPGPMLNLGISSWWAGEADSAKAYFEQVLALQNALSNADIEQVDEAQVDGAQVVEMEAPSLSEPEKQAIFDNLSVFTGPSLNYLGQLSRELGEFDQAEAYYRQALEQDPDNLAALRNLAILLDLYKGQHAEALPLYEQYQSSLDEPDPKVKDWIFDIKNRL